LPGSLKGQGSPGNGKAPGEGRKLPKKVCFGVSGGQLKAMLGRTSWKECYEWNVPLLPQGLREKGGARGEQYYLHANPELRTKIGGLGGFHAYSVGSGRLQSHIEGGLEGTS